MTMHTILESIRHTVWDRASRAKATKERKSSNYSSDDLVIDIAMTTQQSTLPRTSLKQDVIVLSTIRQYTQRLAGWRIAALNFAICASVVFMLNLVVTVWSSVRIKEHEGALGEGNCGQIKRINTVLHVILNALSTILLSGSNYCMQCLSAPTRGEIDKAHAAQRWLDIGVPSIRNLRYVKRRKLVLWLLLGVSSVPLHLL
jgi:hypothetical protein